jgi:hypothetical protein
MKKQKLAIVTWRDSAIYSKQGNLESTDVCVMETAGFLVYQDRDCVKIARDKIEERGVEEWRGLIVIPRENVIKLKELNK